MQLWIINDSFKQELTGNLTQYKKTYFIKGIIFTVLGLIACFAPVLAAGFLNYLIGFLLLITGLIQAGISINAHRHWSYYISAMVAITAGLIMIFWPSAGMLALAVMLGIYLFLEGCMEIFAANVYAPTPGWGWMLFSGIVTLALSVFIFAGWPMSAVWVLGLMLGINFVTFGLAMIMLSK